MINFNSTKIAKKEVLRRKDHPQRLIDILDLDVESIDDKLQEEYELNKAKKSNLLASPKKSNSILVRIYNLTLNLEFPQIE
jgi:hypothetical protein